MTPTIAYTNPMYNTCAKDYGSWSRVAPCTVTFTSTSRSATVYTLFTFKRFPTYIRFTVVFLKEHDVTLGRPFSAPPSQTATQTSATSAAASTASVRVSTSSTLLSLKFDEAPTGVEHRLYSVDLNDAYMKEQKAASKYIGELPKYIEHFFYGMFGENKDKKKLSPPLCEITGKDDSTLRLFVTFSESSDGIISHPFAIPMKESKISPAVMELLCCEAAEVAKMRDDMTGKRPREASHIESPSPKRAARGTADARDKGRDSDTDSDSDVVAITDAAKDAPKKKAVVTVPAKNIIGTATRGGKLSFAKHKSGVSSM